MKNYSKIVPFALLLFVSVITSGFSFQGYKQNNNPDGAWKLENSQTEQVLLFADGYFSQTGYSTKDKKFYFTRGGRYEVRNNQLITTVEFDTRQKDAIGQKEELPFTVLGGQLVVNKNGQKQTWSQVDKGAENLAGTWKITARKQEDKIVPIHQTGARKTVKILSGSRFQWAAINPETKEFFGTGGGNYTFKNGKYTEHIEFFSRDSSRVGASLTFDGELENGKWHHSGLSSRGDSIYEIWERIK